MIIDHSFKLKSVKHEQIFLKSFFAFDKNVQIMLLLEL